MCSLSCLCPICYLNWIIHEVTPESVRKLLVDYTEKVDASPAQMICTIDTVSRYTPSIRVTDSIWSQSPHLFGTVLCVQTVNTSSLLSLASQSQPGTIRLFCYQQPAMWSPGWLTVSTDWHKCNVSNYLNHIGRWFPSIVSSLSTGADLPSPHLCGHEMTNSQPADVLIWERSFTNKLGSVTFPESQGDG